MLNKFRKFSTNKKIDVCDSKLSEIFKNICKKIYDTKQMFMKKNK